MSEDVKYSLEELLPHDHPMILISRIDSYDTSTNQIESSVDIDNNSLFWDDSIEGVPSYLALEYMAQTIAGLSGIYSCLQGTKPMLGFVLGSRKIDLKVDRFTKGSYKVVCKEVFSDSSFASFDCRLLLDGIELVSSILNTYRLKDLSSIET